jgi:hypothetical protein
MQGKKTTIRIEEKYEKSFLLKCFNLSTQMFYLKRQGAFVIEQIEPKPVLGTKTIADAHKGKYLYKIEANSILI